MAGAAPIIAAPPIGVAALPAAFMPGSMPAALGVADPGPAAGAPATPAGLLAGAVFAVFVAVGAEVVVVALLVAVAAVGVAPAPAAVAPVVAGVAWLPLSPPQAAAVAHASSTDSTLTRPIWAGACARVPFRFTHGPVWSESRGVRVRIAIHLRSAQLSSFGAHKCHNGSNELDPVLTTTV
jgi:hypothetical protein